MRTRTTALAAALFAALLFGASAAGAPDDVELEAAVFRLLSGNPAESDVAADALAAAGAAAVPKLKAALAAEPVPGKLKVLRTLERIAVDHDAAVAALAEALAHKEVEIRAVAARGLLAAGPRAKSAEAAMKAALADRFVEVRVSAAAALLRSGAPSAGALSILTTGTKDPNATIRVLTVDLLVRAGVAQATAVPLILEATKDRDSAVAVAAIGALARLGARGPETDRALRRCAQSTDAALRAAAVAAVPKLSDEPVAEIVHFGGAMRGDRLRRGKADKKTSAAVDAALDWLARHQSPDGAWRAEGFDAQCRLNRCDGPGWPQFDVGVTGLALLAFLGAGETHAGGPHKDVVARGLAFLRASQDDDGRIGPAAGGTAYTHAIRGDFGGAVYTTQGDGLLYNHAVATTALCEDWMLTADPEVRGPAAKAVQFALNAKNPYLAWRYSAPGNGDNDTSITGWMAWALATARAAGIEVSELRALKDAAAWAEKMTEPEFGRTGYQQRGSPPTRLHDQQMRFPSDQSEGLTAQGVMTRLFAGRSRDDEFLAKGAALMAKKPPLYDRDRGTIDFLYWFWGATAMRQVDAKAARSWDDALRSALLGSQRAEKDRDELGSWDPEDCWSPLGGRVYATATCCMALEATWRMDLLLEGK
jgi:hypothetical protein